MNAKRKPKSAQQARTYTIAEARNSLARLVHRSEGGPIGLTRRGEPVAVILSQREYERLQRGGGGFAERVRRFRERFADVIANEDLPAVFEEAHDPSPGPEVDLYK